jgi:hypothetical protein
LASFTALAFVIRVDQTGSSAHWDLVTPEVHVGPSARIPVSTNVVNLKTRAIRFFLAADAYSPTNIDAELNAVRAAFGQWQAAPGTLLKFEDAGLVAPGVDVDELDHTNVIFWAKNSTLVAGGRADLGNAQAMTYYATIENVMVGADIVFNAVGFQGCRWYTDFDYKPISAWFQFVEEVALHEVGHLIGLEHSPLGGATLFFRGGLGVGSRDGLSNDDVLGAQFLYPQGTLLAARGRIQGRVTMNGAGVLGAIVCAEDPAGNVVTATLSRQDGSYDLPALVPGNCQVHVAPLDPDSSYYLVRGGDILAPDFSAAQTGFLPTTNVPVVVQANAIRTLDLPVTVGQPAFRISQLRTPTSDAGSQGLLSTGAAVAAGQSNVVLGVYGPNLPATGATLEITGDGLSVTPLASTGIIYGLRLISVLVTINSNATPGLRSFVVRRGNDVAYANGFLEVQPAVLDFNFDGLDDRFQRRYFPLFTAPAAAPDADPDGDGFNNRFEYLAGSDPTRADSGPSVRIERVSLSAQGSALSWGAVPGGRYQVFSRNGFAVAETWKSVGSPVLATNAVAQFLDASATNFIRFYRVQTLRP